jgi:hypothetical protein
VTSGSFVVRTTPSFSTLHTETLKSWEGLGDRNEANSHYIIMFKLYAAGNLYNRKVLIIPVDFTDGQQVYENIAKQLADLDIGILGMYFLCVY